MPEFKTSLWSYIDIFLTPLDFLKDSNGGSKNTLQKMWVKFIDFKNSFEDNSNPVKNTAYHESLLILKLLLIHFKNLL